MLSMHVRLHGLSWCDRIRYKFVYWNLVEWLEHPDGRSLHGTLTAGGQFVVIFICGRSDGTAFKPDAVGFDVITAFAGKEAALAADAAAVAVGFALVVVAGYAPCGTERDLGADAAAALFALLFDSVLRAFDIKGAADIGIDASGMGLGTNGNADADLYAGIAVFAVLMLAVLGGEQPDVARGIKADGVARSNVAALDGNVALAAADIDVAASFQAVDLAFGL